MREHDEPTALRPNSGLVIGAFDGLHRGHQALIASALQGCEHVALVTFDPHPAEVLTPERAPPRLQSRKQRARVCESLGVDDLVTLPFDAKVAATSPSDFVTHYLIEGLRPRRVVVGEDFRYGAKAAGNVESLRAQLQAAGIEFEALSQVNDGEGHKLGSSAIRDHVRAGRVEAAAELLGYLYPVSGKVEHGHARGRKLGVPTANIASECLVPATGVYAGWATLHSGPLAGQVFAAATNVGFNPTFADPTADPGDASPTVEVHLLEARLGERLYGEELEFSFAQRLRDEARFASAEELKAAIAKDLRATRDALAEVGPERRRPPSVRPD